VALKPYIIRLGVGEALVFAPSAFVACGEGVWPRKLNAEVVKIAVRRRVTWDGGGRCFVFDGVVFDGIVRS
jgi:hypothetical protein